MSYSIFSLNLSYVYTFFRMKTSKLDYKVINSVVQGNLHNCTFIMTYLTVEFSVSGPEFDKIQNKRSYLTMMADGDSEC